MALKHTGDGGAYLAGVPARDLTDDDLADIAEREGWTVDDLLESGLYVKDKTPAAPVAPAPSDTKSAPQEGGLTDGS